jgi:capsule polysaccharide export protein KpsE/RkpR
MQDRGFDLPRTLLPVVCWDEVFGPGSLETGLLDRREYAQISIINQALLHHDQAYSYVNKLPLVAVFDTVSKAEREVERLEEDRYLREVESGELAEFDYELIYEVLEIDREALDDSVFDQLGPGLTVRIS